ncbi:MAG: YigZ family protein, partial [Ignavibacteriales bacterium]
CFAYKLIDATIRYSDSGEPSGTAGVRILSAIDHFNLSNQLVVVTRYYGGIKLGVGPLGKAYYNAAHKILSESAIKTKTLLQKVLIKSEVNHINHIYKILSGSKSIISRKGDVEVIVLDCLIPFSEIDSISKKLIDITANKIEINPSSKFIYK